MKSVVFMYCKHELLQQRSVICLIVVRWKLTFSCWLWWGRGVDIRAAGLSFLLLPLLKALLTRLEGTVGEQKWNLRSFKLSWKCFFFFFQIIHRWMNEWVVESRLTWDSLLRWGQEGTGKQNLVPSAGWLLRQNITLAFTDGSNKI